MTRLVWDNRDYEVGLDRGVFYSPNGLGEAWNGLTSVQESSSDTEGMTRYIDGVKTLHRNRAGDFSGTIEAFTYPDSFFDDVLTQRHPTSFGLSYRTKNEIHLVYNVLVEPSSFNSRYLETEVFSWTFSTKPVPVPGAKSSAHLVIDTSKAYTWTLEALEDILYGSESGPPRLPSPKDIFEVFEINSILKVTDNGDGSFTVEGPDDILQMVDPTTFQITWPSAVYIDDKSYILSSL